MGSNLSVSGSKDAISATTGDGITVSSGTGDTIIGSAFTVHAASGDGDQGWGNGLTGPNDVVSGSNASVGLEANSHMTLNGSIDTATMAAVSNLTVSGSNDAIHAVSGDGIMIRSGTSGTIKGSDFTVHPGSGTGFTIVGTGDVVYAGLNDAITDGGSSTEFRIKSNVGDLAISGFGADPTGIIDLLNRVGGYTSASQAFAALRSDGHGGSLLSLGADGSIDLYGVASSSLHARNFKIG